VIFRRKKRELEPEETPAESADESTDPTAEDTDGSTDDVESATANSSSDWLDVDALDAEDWRVDGPYDISEVGGGNHEADDETEDDVDAEGGQPKIDLGSIIVTGFTGAELRLQVAEETQQIVSAMLVSGDSALELGAYAAPRSGGLWPELRDELTESATEAGGSAALIEGPFGVELRRLMPVTTPDGEQGYQPSRMWVVEGPRWLLRGIVYGQAALADGVESPTAELVAAFRQVVVRRGDEAMAPGDLLALTLPQNLIAADDDARDGSDHHGGEPDSDEPSNGQHRAGVAR